MEKKELMRLLVEAVDETQRLLTGLDRDTVPMDWVVRSLLIGDAVDKEYYAMAAYVLYGLIIEVHGMDTGNRVMLDRLQAVVVESVLDSLRRIEKEIDPKLH